MTVIASEYDPEYTNMEHGSHCTLCDRKLFPPFIYWLGEVDQSTIYICGRCGPKMAPGLAADLIQLKAIEDLRQMSPSYERMTLMRKDPIDVKMDAEARKLAEDQALRESREK